MEENSLFAGINRSAGRGPVAGGMGMRNILLLILFLIQVGAAAFPTDRVTPSKILELTPTEMCVYSDYDSQYQAMEKKYSGIWSTRHYANLSDLKIRVRPSSELGPSYVGANLLDGNPKTAWVEGANGDGRGEWMYIDLDARLDSPSSTPFTIDEIGVIPGYFKNLNTWFENNRVKSLLVVVHTLPECSPPQNEWVTYRLLLQDDFRLQVFDLPDDSIGLCCYPMKKEVWIRIEDVYPGTKYHDTCISEMVLAGGCLP